MIIIRKGGMVEAIYDDELVSILNLKDMSIKRASHVEPDDQGMWFADMEPSGGGKLGPFATRREALNAEVEWLEDQMWRSNDGS